MQYGGDESKTCVGSLMIWLNPNCKVTCSILLPLELVCSFAHQFVSCALKSPIATKRNFAQGYLRFSQNFYKIFQKSLETDLLICREQQNDMSCPQLSSHSLYIHLKCDIEKT